MVTSCFYGCPRGLRQGDPLSLILFLIMIEESGGAGLIGGFKANGRRGRWSLCLTPIVCK